ncbi:hypothetical protein INR49_019656 [Caranx melampygus]|nr:hypothetical protein INR49_019656 [Caranx melampygus]
MVFEEKMIMNGEPEDEGKKRKRRRKKWWILLNWCDRSVSRQSTASTLRHVWRSVRPGLGHGLLQKRIALRSCLISCMLGTTA